MRHIYVSVNWVSIGSENDLSPVRHQAITWTNAGLLLIGLLGTNFNKIESEFYHLHSRKCIWNCRLPKWRPFCPGWRWVNHLFVKPSFLQFQIYKASFNSLAPGRCSCNLRLIIFKLISEIEISSSFPLKLPSAESHKASLMINQHWFG